VTKVGVAEGFDNVKNLEDVAFFVAESKVCILLRLEGNFDQTEGIRPKTRQIVDYVAREQSKQIVEDIAQIKQIVDLKKRVFGREFEDQNRTPPKANQGASGESKTRGNGVSQSLGQRI